MSHEAQHKLEPVTVVTVVFEAEISLLALQARSLDRFVTAGEFDQILVIDNTRRGLRPRQHEMLLSQYGRWRDKVTFVRPHELGLERASHGWVDQQILKLLIHAHVQTGFYVVLDAKNHWLRPTSRATFVNPDGRARGGSHTYRAHALRTSLVRVLDYLGVDPAPWLDGFPVVHTPVVLETAIVRRLTAEIAGRSGHSFAEEFVTAELTEFMLYAGWIIATYGELAGHIDGTVVQCATVWPGQSSTADFRRALEAATRRDAPFLAIHRTALARANLRAMGLLANFWMARGLFASRRSALSFLAAYKFSYLSSMSIRKVRAVVSRRRGG